MFKVILQENAQRKLDELYSSNQELFKKVMSSLDQLEKKGLKSSNIKKLLNSESIFRKRVGRIRVLFTLDDRQIDVWIIEIEKDTKKDYKRWLKYIKKYQ